MSSDEIKMILEKLDAMESKMDAMETRQHHIETGIVNIGARLEALENIVDERLQDTRPLWEGVQSQISEMREEMRERFDGLESEVKDTNRRVRVLNDTMLSMKADLLGLEDRVEKLEGREAEPQPSGKRK
jgi:chromosome segregation ATPase